MEILLPTTLSIFYFPEFQEISVCLQADAGVEEGNADDGCYAVVAPPDQEPGVGGAGVGGLHQSIDALVSEHHQNWQAGHLDVTLQTKQNIESTNISIWIQGSLADFF